MMKDRTLLMLPGPIEFEPAVLAALGRRYGALVIVDGVCSVAGKELRMGEWGVDVALEAGLAACGYTFEPSVGVAAAAALRRQSTS